MGNQVSNTLTYLDLLELVKIGKQPKRVKYCEKVHEWSEEDNTYIDISLEGFGKFLDLKVAREMTMEGACTVRSIEVLPNRPRRILDTVERNYLLKALVPLKAVCVRKDTLDGGRFCIRYQAKNGTFFRLPPVDAGTMYEGMEPDRWYDLEYLLSQPARPVNRK